MRESSWPLSRLDSTVPLVANRRMRPAAVERQTHLLADGRPGGAQHPVGESQADEADVAEQQQHAGASICDVPRRNATGGAGDQAVMRP